MMYNLFIEKEIEKQKYPRVDDDIDKHNTLMMIIIIHNEAIIHWFHSF